MTWTQFVAKINQLRQAERTMMTLHLTPEQEATFLSDPDRLRNLDAPKPGTPFFFAGIQVTVRIIHK